MSRGQAGSICSHSIAYCQHNHITTKGVWLCQLGCQSAKGTAFAAAQQPPAPQQQLCCSWSHRIQSRQTIHSRLQLLGRTLLQVLAQRHKAAELPELKRPAQHRVTSATKLCLCYMDTLFREGMTGLPHTLLVLCIPCSLSCEAAKLPLAHRDSHSWGHTTATD